ncbi:MAG: putative porin, partial [Candidatus Aureabacteria bacterium]|nr:putative porin [Candidatus Auribacterota bacterium]
AIFITGFVTPVFADFYENTKFKGDLRLRYQTQEETDKETRSRERIRFRFGFETEITEQLKVVAGLASGGDDPRSTNETMDDNFSTKGIALDLAYFEWKPSDPVKLTLGKFGKPSNYLTLAKDLLFDGDINFEGQHIWLGGEVAPDVEIYAQGGIFWLDEYSSTEDDPFMFPIQAGISGKADAIKYKLAVAYYSFTNLEGNSFYEGGGTNTVDDDEGLVYDYNSYGLTGVIEYGFAGGDGKDYMFKVGGEYIKNDDVSEDGYLILAAIGSKKIKDPGTWQVAVNYRELEKDAWLDIFPDSDAFSGKTDIKGYEFIVEYAVAKNVILGLDYYDIQRISSDKDQQVLQLDCVIKF